MWREEKSGMKLKSIGLLRCHCLTKRWLHVKSGKEIPLVNPITEKTYFKLSQTNPKLHALKARLQLDSRLTASILAQVLLDKTAFPETENKASNEKLAVIGGIYLDYVSTEYLTCRYPRLPLTVIEAAKESLIGKESLLQLSKAWGVEIGGAPDEVHCGKLIFRRVQRDHVKEQGVQEYVNEAVLTMVNALIGAMYLRCGKEETINFIQSQILDRELDLENMISFTHPQGPMTALVNREKWNGPILKMLAESGRKTNKPLFLAGVYINNELVGQGEDTSIKRAYRKAISNALKAYILYEEKEFQLPSEALKKGIGFKGNYIDHGVIIS